MKRYSLFIISFLLATRLTAQDLILGSLVAVERKIAVNLDDCAKKWNDILHACSVLTSENANKLDFVLPNQENFRKFTVGEMKCGIGLSLYSSQGTEGYYIRYVDANSPGRVPFAVARPCIAKALSDQMGVITAKIYTLK